MRSLLGAPKPVTPQPLIKIFLGGQLPLMGPRLSVVRVATSRWHAVGKASELRRTPAWPSASPCVSSSTNNDPQSVGVLPAPARATDGTAMTATGVCWCVAHEGKSSSGSPPRTAAWRPGGTHALTRPRVGLTHYRPCPMDGVVGPYLLYAHVVAEHRQGPVSQAPVRHEGRPGHAPGRRTSTERGGSPHQELAGPSLDGR